MYSALVQEVSVASEQYATNWTGIEYFANATLRKLICLHIKVSNLYICCVAWDFARPHSIYRFETGSVAMTTNISFFLMAMVLFRPTALSS